MDTLEKIAKNEYAQRFFIKPMAKVLIHEPSKAKMLIPCGIGLLYASDTLLFGDHKEAWKNNLHGALGFLYMSYQITSYWAGAIGAVQAYEAVKSIL